jgi:hypothetical protein
MGLPTDRWNTYRLCGYGAIAGALYGVIAPHFSWFNSSTEAILFDLGGIAGAALGAAVLVGIVSGLRNLFVGK